MLFCIMQFCITRVLCPIAPPDAGAAGEARGEKSPATAGRSPAVVEYVEDDGVRRKLGVAVQSAGVNHEEVTF